MIAESDLTQILATVVKEKKNLLVVKSSDRKMMAVHKNKKK